MNNDTKNNWNDWSKNKNEDKNASLNLEYKNNSEYKNIIENIKAHQYKAKNDKLNNNPNPTNDNLNYTPNDSSNHHNNNNFIKNYWNKISIFNKNFHYKPLKIHLLWAVIFTIFLLFVTGIVLNIITGHSDYYTLPNVIKMTSEDATKILEDNGVTPKITDSLYIEGQTPNIILKQIPEPNSIVKKGRIVFLIVNRNVAPQVNFPNIKGMTYQSVAEILKMKGFFVNDTTYKNDIAKDIVIDYLYKGASIKSGQYIPLSSGISLILGNGIPSEIDYVWVPSIESKKYSEAKQIANSLHLTLKIMSGQDANDPTTNDKIIFRQNPLDITEDLKKNKILQNSEIEIWLSE